jgi:hypothetical protein
MKKAFESKAVIMIVMVVGLIGVAFGVALMFLGE